jgi:DNA-binding MarR family transcriptional regulator
VKRRKLLVLIALAVREHGTAPTWNTLRRALGVDRVTLVRLMERLEGDGCVTFDPNTPGSARVTPHGLREAVGR